LCDGATTVGCEYPDEADGDCATDECGATGFVNPEGALSGRSFAFRTDAGPRLEFAPAGCV
jgi:hypothetical protein